MSWYYAGPEAKPVGPVSLEELQARRAGGQVAAETYIIEHSGQPGGVGEWKRYSEVFPPAVTASMLPPVPSAPVTYPPVPAPMVAPMPAPHALFPSAGSPPVLPPVRPAYTPTVPPHAAPHAGYPVYRTNSCCAWGFGLGLAGFLLSPFCGIGFLSAAPGLLICIVGFAQVQQRRDQSGRGLAIAGAMLAMLGLLISIGFFSYMVPSMMKSHRDADRQENSDGQ